MFNKVLNLHPHIKGAFLKYSVMCFPLNADQLSLLQKVLALTTVALEVTYFIIINNLYFNILRNLLSSRKIIFYNIRHQSGYIEWIHLLKMSIMKVKASLFPILKYGIFVSNQEKNQKVIKIRVSQNWPCRIFFLVGRKHW